MKYIFKIKIKCDASAAIDLPNVSDFCRIVRTLASDLSCTFFTQVL